jgi:hypothetical protein
MAKTMLAISLLVGAGACSSPAPTAQRSGLVNPPVTEPEPTSTTAATTTVPPTTTPTEPPVTTTEAPTTVPTTRARSAPTTRPYVAPAPARTGGSGACGGDLPPCYVMQRESGGDPTAIGEGQCGNEDCYGKWQIHPDTAESVGYPRRMDLQPESVQDDAARAILARDGCKAWSTC